MAVQSLQLFIRSIPDAESANAIATALKQAEGVRFASVNWRQGTSDITFDDSITSADNILQNPALKSGYKIEICEDYCSS